MTTLTADGAMLATLKQATELAEIRDEQGNIIGFFAPVSMEYAHLYARAAAQINPQELQRRRERAYATTRAGEADLPEIEHRAASSRGGKTTRELFELLETLATNPADLADIRRHLGEIAERDRCDSR